MLLPYLILFLALTAMLAVVWGAGWLLRTRDDAYQSGFDHGFLEGAKSERIQTQQKQPRLHLPKFDLRDPLIRAAWTTAIADPHPAKRQPLSN